MWIETSTRLALINMDHVSHIYWMDRNFCAHMNNDKEVIIGGIDDFFEKEHFEEIIKIAQVSRAYECAYGAIVSLIKSYSDSNVMKFDFIKKTSKELFERR